MIIFLETDEGLTGALQADQIQEDETTSTWPGSTRNSQDRSQAADLPLKLIKIIERQ